MSADLHPNPYLDFVDIFDEYTCDQCAYFWREKDKSRIGACIAHSGRSVWANDEACPDFEED